jgi:hypothetical protein
MQSLDATQAAWKHFYYGTNKKSVVKKGCDKKGCKKLW